jgi:hypothetical protein
MDIRTIVQNFYIYPLILLFHKIKGFGLRHRTVLHFGKYYLVSSIVFPTIVFLYVLIVRTVLCIVVLFTVLSYQLQKCYTVLLLTFCHKMTLAQFIKLILETLIITQLILKNLPLTNLCSYLFFNFPF